MYTILLSIPKSTKHSNPNEVNWESVDSHFADLCSEEFICVVKPFNGDHTRAKVYFRKKVTFGSRADEFLINNSVPAKIIERKEDPNLPPSSSRTVRLPRGFTESQLAEIRVDLDEQFKAELRVASADATATAAGGSSFVLQACHPEVLDCAEAALRKWATSAVSSASASAAGPSGSSGAGRPGRRPLFPGAVGGGAAVAVPTAAGNFAPAREADLQCEIGPYDFELPLNDRCSLRVQPHDITALQCDLMVVTTSCAVSLNFGLARVVAAKSGSRALQQLCQLQIAQQHAGGNLKFGDTCLVQSPPGSQLPARHLLFLALPNDKRLTESVDATQFKAVMRDVVSSLLDKIFALSEDPAVRCRVVAMTPIGASLPYWADLSEDFAHVLAGGFWEARARTRDLRQIHVCDLGLNTLATLGRVLEARFGVRLTPQRRAARGAVAAEAGGGGMDVVVGDIDDIDDRDDDDDCEICCTPLTPAGGANPPVQFHCNRGRLCAACVRRLSDPGAGASDGRCPICLERYRPAMGNQPIDGNMTVTKESVSLPGHEGHATLVVTYTFGPGVQDRDHPNPGQPYRGASRVTYFPDSPEGRAIVQRLRVAFDGRAVFTVGTSATTGMENTLTWATVHHKTNIGGGPERHGYPDPTYLQRIDGELTALGY